MSSAGGVAATRSDLKQKVRQMHELNTKQKQILNHLIDAIHGDTEYFKSKRIAEEIGLSSKEVGKNIGSVRHSIDFIHIEKWGESDSITWRVQLST